MYGMSYLPAGGAVAVPLVLEVGDVLHHPVVDLSQPAALNTCSLGWSDLLTRVE